MIVRFPTPTAGKIALVTAPRGVIQSLMVMIATLALRGEVIVVDGGNCLDGYALARALRERTSQVQEGLKQILLSRAFTCYQMVALLGALPAGDTPVIVLDILATFLDENVAFAKRQRLLENSIRLLQQISASAPVAIWARTHNPAHQEEQRLLRPLLESAHTIWELQSPVTPTYQPPLF